MIRRAYPTADEAMKEELCVKHFKESLDNAGMEWAVHDKLDEVTSDGALAAAMNYEAFHVGRSRRRDDTGSNWKNLSAAQIKKILMEDKKKTSKDRIKGDKYKDSKNSPKKKPSPAIYPCHLCKELGHWKNECPLYVRSASGEEDAGNED
jgi:hypothetical protein